VHRRIYVSCAFILGLLATALGWSQSLNYKITPLIPLALWFPLVVITGARDLAGVAVAVIQFPLFALAFAFGIRRWSLPRVLAVQLLIYASLALLALGIVWSR
jgi:hypothetical protein